VPDVTTFLAAVNVVALLGTGGLFFSVLPFAMANDSPLCGPLLRYGFPQIAAFGGLIASVLLGAAVAVRAGDHAGWPAVGTGALGWAVWVGGVVVTMTLFFGVGRLDTALAQWRRRDVPRRGDR
jgi:hypothetical protein